MAQSFRNFNAQVHFTNWVIGHSHLAFVASFSFLAFALVYHILPRILGRDPFERRLMEWHYWLTLFGLLTFMITLWAAGLIQGQNWLTGGIPFINTVQTMKPYMFMRMAGGLTIGAGVAVFAYAVLRSLGRPGTGTAPTGV